MATDASNTITFGSQTPTISDADKKASVVSSEAASIRKLLEVHRVQSTNDRNTTKGYSTGLQSFKRAIDMILKINEDWAFQILWDYFLANNAGNGSTSEGRVFRGGLNDYADIDKYATLYNLFRSCTLNYYSVITEDACVKRIGNANIVIWAISKTK